MDFDSTTVEKTRSNLNNLSAVIVLYFITGATIGTSTGDAQLSLLGGTLHIPEGGLEWFYAFVIGMFIYLFTKYWIDRVPVKKLSYYCRTPSFRTYDSNPIEKILSHSRGEVLFSARPEWKVRFANEPARDVYLSTRPATEILDDFMLVHYLDFQIHQKSLLAVGALPTHVYMPKRAKDIMVKEVSRYTTYHLDKITRELMPLAALVALIFMLVQYLIEDYPTVGDVLKLF